MAYYAPKKDFLANFHNEDIKVKLNSTYTEIIKYCKKLIIIGVSNNKLDDHIWQPIEQFDLQICIVNPEIEDFKVQFGDKIKLHLHSFEDCFNKLKINNDLLGFLHS